MMRKQRESSRTSARKRQVGFTVKEPFVDNTPIEKIERKPDLISSVGRRERRPRGVIKNTSDAEQVGSSDYLMNIQNRHSNQTIYILGNGPEIACLDDRTYETIKNGISIGTNATHLIFPKTTYYVAGHPIHYVLNCKHGLVDKSRFYHGWDITQDIDYEKNRTVRYENIPRSPVYSEEYRNQISFSAINIACLMNPSRIIFIGIDMKSNQRFYDQNTSLKEKLLEQVKSIQKEAKSSQLSEDTNNTINILTGKMSINYANTYGRFRGEYTRVFKEMRSIGIQPVIHNANSILAEAGADILENIDERSSSNHSGKKRKSKNTK